jgi:hypothetical protein
MIVAVAVAALLASARAAEAREPATTAPGFRYRSLGVTITDSRLLLTTHVVRYSEVVAFYIYNAGKKPHNFIVSGRKSKRVAHGRRANLLVDFPERGKYLFRCSLNCKPWMRGYLRILPF